MPRKNPPLLRRSSLTGRVWIITRYVRTDDGRGDIVNAIEKYDVTDQFNALAAEQLREYIGEGGDPSSQRTPEEQG